MVASHCCQARITFCKGGGAPVSIQIFSRVASEATDIPQRLIIFETKGQHLSGNSDTQYKEKVLEMLEKAYENATDCGTMTAVAPDGQSMLFRILLENTWRETANVTLAES